MLKKTNPSIEKKGSFSTSKITLATTDKNTAQYGNSEDNLEKFKRVLDGFHKTEIGDAIETFNADHIHCYEKNVNFGILELLEGTWISYISNNDMKINAQRIDNNIKNQGKQALDSKPYLLSSGIHTTIMPSPGTNSETIPGKYSFECDQYIEKLTFTKVEGGVRNRGGVNEQFCGAYKYDQVIKKVNLIPSKFSQDSQTKMRYDYFPKAKPSFDKLEVKGIHEENGMYLWLSDVYNHAATEGSIKEDRGMKPISKDDPRYPVYKSKGLIKIDKNGLEEPCYPTHTCVKLYDDPKLWLLEDLSNEQNNKIEKIYPAKELNNGDGLKGPHYLPDYTLSRSGVIPHGSTITLLGNMKRYDEKLYRNYAPDFLEGKHIWDYKHLSISPTMGRAGAPRDFNSADGEVRKQFDIDQGMPSWRLLSLLELDVEDPGGNKVYSKQIVSHPLFPYSVRPDLRLRDSNIGERIEHTAKIEMFTKNESGTQGGILNIPFVNKYVPTIDMTMNMWLQVVKTKGGKHVLQLQYEQIVNFEFHFGDDGGTTRWPHIQVNTLRKEEEMSEADIAYFYAIFNKDKTDGNGNQPVCPFGHK